MKNRPNRPSKQQQVHTSRNPADTQPLLMCSGRAADQSDLFASLNDDVTCPGCLIGLIYLAVTHIKTEQPKNV